MPVVAAVIVGFCCVLVYANGPDHEYEAVPDAVVEAFKLID